MQMTLLTCGCSIDPKKRRSSTSGTLLERRSVPSSRKSLIGTSSSILLRATVWSFYEFCSAKKTGTRHVTYSAISSLGLRGNALSVRVTSLPFLRPVTDGRDENGREVFQMSRLASFVWSLQSLSCRTSSASFVHLRQRFGASCEPRAHVHVQP